MAGQLDQVHPLKRARLDASPPLLQRDVASAAGCSISLVCMLENGYRPRSAIVLDRVAAVFGASVGSFWPGA